MPVASYGPTCTTKNKLPVQQYKPDQKAFLWHFCAWSLLLWDSLVVNCTKKLTSVKISLIINTSNYSRITKIGTGNTLKVKPTATEQPVTKNHNTSADNWELAKKEGWWLKPETLPSVYKRPGHHNYSQPLWLIRKSPIDTVLIFQFSCLSKIKLTFQHFSAWVWNLAQNFRKTPTMIFLLKTIVWLTVSGGIISSLRMNVMIRCAAFKS